MANNINFIPATDLPVAEGEEISVLCLENGAMKQKPAKGLGGGNYDIKIRLWFEHDSENDEIIPKGEVLEGSFEAVKHKFDSEQPALAVIIEDGMAFAGTGDMPYKFIFTCNLTALYNPDNLEEMVFTGWCYRGEVGILPDNTIMFN